MVTTTADLFLLALGGAAAGGTILRWLRRLVLPVLVLAVMVVVATAVLTAATTAVRAQRALEPCSPARF